GNWSGAPETPLADGSYAFTATQTDPAGNTSGVSNTVTVTIDSTAPDAPVIAGPVDGSVLDTDMPVSSGSREPGSTVTVVDGDGNVILVADVDVDGYWSGTPDDPLEDRESMLIAHQTHT